MQRSYEMQRGNGKAKDTVKEIPPIPTSNLDSITKDNRYSTVFLDKASFWARGPTYGPPPLEL